MESTLHFYIFLKQIFRIIGSFEHFSTIFTGKQLGMKIPQICVGVLDSCQIGKFSHPQEKVVNETENKRGTTLQDLSEAWMDVDFVLLFNVYD